MNSAEAHNTALIRAADGSADRCLTWRGGLRFFAEASTVKAVEVAEEDPALLKQGFPADQQAMYQRTVALLETPARANQPPGAYAVDIFRLQGGTTHDYYIHSLGDAFSLTGAELRPVADPKLSLYEVSGFAHKTAAGTHVITGISRTKTDDAFTAAWRDLKDWRTLPPAVDREAVVQVRMLGVPGTEVFVGTAPGQRYIDARDVAQRAIVMCVRRSADAFRDAPDAFVAVIDAGRQQGGTVKQIGRLMVSSGDSAALGVRIEHRDGVDYVLSATQDDVETTFREPGTGQKIVLTGRLGVVRVVPERPAALVLLRGTHLTGDVETPGRR
ncbi:MAG: hypothetical protein A3F84_29760 [Candidatus Handelsmanbacteria bacterium RIFCSPLOWO2_12_FULL_64_10]|uniref:Uncharacterized protein n=1 Tax=Handelsmanbacteria sp. (strain RIFCSPLOWO2_12_FULL_64_10) TaxID=1817868 RepID=A0A1F6D256_HANXR|nr:MAG: hypothetical protein A3F84_29760 [Candidatus Handelsmanbacteria bacterium RIFCSPLOWO2_12_FULL_64_10]